MLHLGLARWEDIKFPIQASAHVSPECLATVLDIMEAAWPADDAHLKKFSVNALIGRWANQEQYTYNVRTSQHAEDCLGYHMKRLVSFNGNGKGQVTTDYIFATRLVGNISWRPIWDTIMAIERTRVAQMRWILERLGVPSRGIRQIKTDCLVLIPARKLIPKLMSLGEIRNCDLANLVQTHMGTLPVIGGQKRLNDGISMTCTQDESHVFRWTRGAEVKLLQGRYREPELNVPAPSLVPSWRHLGEEEAKQGARTEGLLICGCPGVGKSFWARELVAQLRSEGKVVS